MKRGVKNKQPKAKQEKTKTKAERRNLFDNHQKDRRLKALLDFKK